MEHSPLAPIIRVHGSHVTIASPTNDDADLYYTLDGRDPTPAASMYPREGSLDLGIGQLVVKAIAVRNGVGSPIATHYYSYTPQALLITPDSGSYEINTNVTIVGEHDEVRYTLDGTIPTADSKRYTGPILLSRTGQIHLTAAMFTDNLPLGDPVRKHYTVHGALVKPPIVTPTGGNYETPLRITIQGDGDVRYTLDGEPPSLETGQHYTGPLVVSTPNDIYLSVCSFLNGRQSAVTVERFSVTSGANADENEQDKSVFPVENIAFGSAVEDSARTKAEEVMAWLLAATEMKERRLAEATQAERELFELKDSYRECLRQIDRINKDLNVANAHRVKLEEVQATHVCPVAQNLRLEIDALERSKEDLALREHSLDSQMEEALALHTKFVGERTQLAMAAKERKESLEEKFLSQKRQLASFDSGLAEEVQELEMVVAEQRNELRQLKATVEALENPSEGTSSDPQPFLKAQRLVELPKTESIVSIPPGMMRRITTVKGNGLQELRKKHFVEACIVSMGGGLAIKVVGHSAGVFEFTEEVERLLEGDG